MKSKLHIIGTHMRNTSVTSIPTDRWTLCLKNSVVHTLIEVHSFHSPGSVVAVVVAVVVVAVVVVVVVV
jgi:hypothetical protein